MHHLNVHALSQPFFTWLVFIQDCHSRPFLSSSFLVQTYQVSLLLFESFSPELNLDDSLSLLLATAQRLLNVEQVQIITRKKNMS